MNDDDWVADFDVQKALMEQFPPRSAQNPSTDGSFQTVSSLSDSNKEQDREDRQSDRQRMADREATEFLGGGLVLRERFEVSGRS